MPISFLRNREFVDQLADKWVWLLVLGLALGLLGAIAVTNVFTTTLASVLIFGWLMIVGGILHLITALRVRSWNPGLYHVVLAILYAFAGLVTLTRPVESAASLTMVISLFLMASGVARVIHALWMRNIGRGWIVANGIISFALGLMILGQWPSSGLWVIGFYVGISMIIDGIALASLAVVLHSRGSHPMGMKPT